MKKSFKGISVGMVLILVIVAMVPVWAAVPKENEQALTAKTFSGADSGTGKSAEDPYMISTLEQLEAFRDYINGGGGTGEYFKLSGDIDLYSRYGEGETSWKPVGYNNNYKDAAPFNGSFDGGNHMIRGLYVSTDNESYLGLFGYVGSQGRIENLNVAGVVGNKSAGCDLYIGGIAGQNSGTISNCAYIGSVYSRKDVDSCVGGVVGTNNGGTVFQCTFSGTVIDDGLVNAGGIVGENHNGILANCTNTGIVTSKGHAGGITGHNYGTIVLSHNSGSISGNMAGGIAGYNGASIMDSYNTGVVSSWSIAGGLVGRNESVDGENVVVANCYNAGVVLGDTVCGGLIGTNTVSDELGTCKIDNCYYLNTVKKGIGMDYANISGTAIMAKSLDSFKSSEVSQLLQGQRATKVWVPPAHEFPWPTLASVYAEERDNFFGDQTDITCFWRAGTPGIYEVDLSNSIVYESGAPVRGKFTYTIVDDGGTGATVDGDILSIPTTTAVGEYKITISASEKYSPYVLTDTNGESAAPAAVTIMVDVLSLDIPLAADAQTASN